jgi:hypothetical protein
MQGEVRPLFKISDKLGNSDPERGEVVPEEKYPDKHHPHPDKHHPHPDKHHHYSPDEHHNETHEEVPQRTTQAGFLPSQKTGFRAGEILTYEEEGHHKEESVSPHNHSESPESASEKQVSFDKLETVLTRNDLLIICCFTADEDDDVEYIKIVNTNGCCCPFFISVGDDLRLINSEKYRNIHLSRGKDAKKKDLVFHDYYHGDVVTHTGEQIERLQTALDSEILIIRGNRLSVMRHGEPRIYFFHDTIRSCVAPLVKLEDFIKDIGEVMSHIKFAYVKLRSLCRSFIDTQYKLFIKRLLSRYDEVRKHMEEVRRNIDILNDDFEFLQEKKDCYRLSEAVISKVMTEFLDLEEPLVEDQI